MKKNTILLVILVGFMLAGCVSSNPPAPETASPSESGTAADKEKEELVRQYLETGQAYEHEGRLSSALEQYSLALTVLPDHARAVSAKQEVTSKLKEKARIHYQQGMAYDKKGQYEAARKEYLSALQNWPDHNEAKKRLTPGGVTDGNREYIIHTLKYGESVSKLSLIYYGNLKKHDIIGKFNILKDAKKVRAGQKLKVPVIKGISLADLKEKQAAYLEGRPPKTLAEPPDITDDEQALSTQEAIEEETLEEESLSKVDPVTDNKPEQDKGTDDYHAMTPDPNRDDPTDVIEPEPADDTPISQTEPIEEPIEAIDETKTASIEPPSLPAAPSKESTQSLSVKQEDTEKSAPPKKDPVDVYQLGIEQFKEKKYSKAIPNFTEAWNKEPDNEILRDYLFQSHFQNGLYLYNKSRYLNAKDNFSQALTYNPACEKCQENIQKSENSYKEKHYNLGIHYFGKENLKKAISEWKKVQKIDPAYKEVAPNLKKAELLFNRLEAIKKSSSN